MSNETNPTPKPGDAALATDMPEAARQPAEESIRSGERFDGGTDEDEKAGAGFGEGDDARRARERSAPPQGEAKT